MPFRRRKAVIYVGRPEDKYVKIPAIVHATRIGYKYLSIHGLEPGKDYDPDTNIFYEQFQEAVERINGRSVDLPRAAYLINQLKLSLGASDLGQAFFKCLQVGVEGYRLVDFDDPRNNSFHVVTELPYANGEDSFRPDIIFLVNGMPLGFMEAKRQNNKDGIQAERDRMVARFSNEAFRRFVNITQVMAFSNNQEYDDADRHQLQGSFYASSGYGHLSYNHFREEDDAGMAAIVEPRNETVERFVCKDNNLASYFGTAEYETSISPDTPANRIVSSIFSPERFLFLLHYGIAYVEKTNDEGVKELQKHVMRYPQLFATKAVRAKLDEGVRQGVIWHTQGSGKTALSFFLTRYLRDYYQAQNRIARFFFIVDRLDLADQSADEFRARGAIVSIVNSKAEFVRALQGSGDGTNAVSDVNTPVITVVNIQKFDDEATAVEFDYGLDVQRVYFIDEAHRDYKNGGAFLANLVTSDRDAIRFALTGTPLVNAKGGNNTREVFGDYIHKYFYNQSIADGYTLKLLREDVRTEFRLKMQEVMSELRETNKLVDIEDVLVHDRYVDPLVDYIVSDYLQSQIQLGDETIGAMIVAHSAPQARRIYAKLCDLDPDLAVGLALDDGDKEQIESRLILHDEGTKQYRREVCDSFKKDDSPINILVVFNMLLTGFDAHRLKKLYLCRKIKAHNLLQALTRVNRPYHDLAFGYVVDFADITEEYDKTNRAYLAELSGELQEDYDKYSSLFEDRDSIESDLARIKDLLFGYTTDNVVEFTNEIGLIDDKAALYELRNALARYKDLRNVAKMLGYDDLYEKFDVDKARELLHEVDMRIQTINNKEALALKDMSTGAINVLLSQIEFNFRRIATDELAIADEFQDKLRRTYGSFAGNIDQDDPEYVNLLDALRKKFAKLDIEEMTSTEMVTSMEELDELRQQMDELNRRNAALAKKYGGDEKFVRAHKRAMRTPPPLTTSPVLLFQVLSRVKAETDETVLSNHNLLGNTAYFQQTVRRLFKGSCVAEGLTPTKDQVFGMADYIASEYIDESRKTA